MDFVSSVASLLATPIMEQMKYLFNLRANMRKLKKAVKNLELTKKEVEEKIKSTTEARDDEVPTERVHEWLEERGIHDRNMKAMELVAKGWSALQEVDRVIDHTELNDPRLIPLLRGAKESFELALEIDNMNTHARYWLGRMHFKYHVPGACKLVGAALLVEAANMGDADAQYELGCHLRIENDHVQSDQQGFYYIEKAVDQLHPGALYLLGAVYLTGDCVKKDVASAMWCFHRASEKGHARAAIAYGSLLLKGFEVPEEIQEHPRGSSEESQGTVPGRCRGRI